MCSQHPPPRDTCLSLPKDVLIAMCVQLLRRWALTALLWTALVPLLCMATSLGAFLALVDSDSPLLEAVSLMSFAWSLVCAFPMAGVVVRLVTSRFWWSAYSLHNPSRRRVVETHCTLPADTCARACACAWMCLPQGGCPCCAWIVADVPRPRVAASGHPLRRACNAHPAAPRIRAAVRRLGPAAAPKGTHDRPAGFPSNARGVPAALPHATAGS